MEMKSSRQPVVGQKVTRRMARGTSAADRWVLAIDPYSEMDFMPVARFIKSLAGEGEVFGTHVLAPDSLNWMGDFSGPWLKRYKPVAEAQAKEMGAKLGIEIEVVPSRNAGLKGSVETLIRYAKKIKAENILVCTHARSGLERWFLGSFAESVILSSPIPVMVVNPSQKVPTKVRKILVPTDLSLKSSRFISKVSEFALKVGASVELFYKRPDPLDPMIQQGVYAVGGGWVSVQSYLDESAKESRLKLDTMAEKLRMQGLTVDTVVDSTTNSLVDAIEKTAEERNADVIAVLTQSGAIAATLLGSVARSLVRTSNIPIMIYR